MFESKKVLLSCVHKIKRESMLEFNCVDYGFDCGYGLLGATKVDL